MQPSPGTGSLARPLLIGLCGAMGAGKSTAGKLLSSMTGLPVVPFAGPLKAMLAAAGVPARNLYGTPEDKAEPIEMLCGRSARYAMQTLGTEWRDTIGRDLWLNLWLAKTTGGAIADDVRFMHEVEAIRSRGGIIIKMIGRGVEGDGHASENVRALPFDYIVPNDKDHRALAAGLHLMLSRFRTARANAVDEQYSMFQDA